MPGENIAVLGQQVEEEARRQGVDPNIARGLLLSENSYFDRGGNLVTNGSVDPRTVSPKQAAGVMQVTPPTAQELMKGGFLDPDTDLSQSPGQIKAGVATIKELNSRGITAPFEVASAYNGGNAALSDVRGGKTPNPETADYLRKFSKHTGLAMPDLLPPSSTPTDGSPVSSGTVATPKVGVDGVTSISSMQKEGASTSNRVFPPGILEAVTKNADAFNGLSSDLQGQLLRMQQQITGNLGVAGGAAADIGTAKTQADKAQETIDLATDTNRQNMLAMFGTTPNDPDNVIGRNMSVINTVQPQRDALQSQIAQLKSGRSFLSDPVGWFMSGLQLQPLVAKHNALVSQETAAVNNISEAQDLTRQQTLIQSPVLAEGIRQRALAQANLNVADAKMKQTELSAGSMGAISRTLMDMDSIGGTQLAHAVQVADLQAERISVSSTTGQRETQTDRDQIEQLADVNKVITTYGQDPIKLLVWKGMNQEQKQNLIELSRFKANKDGTVAGPTPGVALGNFYNAFGNSGLAKVSENAPIVAKTMATTIDEGRKAVAALEVQAANPVPTPEKYDAIDKLRHAKNDTERTALGIDIWYAKTIKPELSKQDYMQLSDTNPYKFNYTIAPTAAALADNPYAQYTLDPPKGIKVNDQVILSKAVADVGSNPGSVGQVAQQLTDFYKKGSDFQRRETNMTQLGFPTNPNSYPLVAKVNTLNPLPVNMFDRQSVENWLIRQSVAVIPKNPVGLVPMIPTFGNSPTPALPGQ